MTTRSTPKRRLSSRAKRAGLGLAVIALASIAVGCITPSDPRLDDESRHEAPIVRAFDGRATTAVDRRGLCRG